MSSTTSGHAAPRNWRTLLAAICFAQATAIVGFDFTLPFIPLYLRHDLGVHGLGQVALWAGLIGFGPAIPATIFGPLWGRLADRLGYRFMLLRAMTAAAILLALMGLVTSPWLLLGLRMVQGALTGTVFAAQALVAAAAPEKETGRAIGLLQMSVFVGATFGPIGGGTVAELIGFRTSYLAAGVLIALATAVVFIFVWEPKHQQTRREAEAEAPSMRSVLLIPAFAGALGLVLVSQLAGTALFPVLPLFVQDLLHSTRNVATATGWLMAASGLAAGVGSYVAGRLQRRFAVRGLLIGALLLSALLFVPLAFVQSFGALLVVRCLGAVAYGGVVSLVGTIAATASPPNAKGTAFGMMGAASSLGFGIGPLLGGALAASVGIRPVFLLSAVLLALGPLVLIGLMALASFLHRSLSAPAQSLAPYDG